MTLEHFILSSLICGRQEKLESRITPRYLKDSLVCTLYACSVECQVGIDLRAILFTAYMH